MASAPIVDLPPSWPAMSLEQVCAALTAPGAKFEMDEAVIDGVPTRVWKNAPPTMRFLLEASRAHGERLFVIHEDERVDMLRVDDGEARYRLCASDDHHHHLVCRECGRTVEIEGPAVE